MWRGLLVGGGFEILYPRASLFWEFVLCFRGRWSWFPSDCAHGLLVAVVFAGHFEVIFLGSFHSFLFLSFRFSFLEGFLGLGFLGGLGWRMAF